MTRRRLVVLSVVLVLLVAVAVVVVPRVWPRCGAQAAEVDTAEVPFFPAGELSSELAGTGVEEQADALVEFLDSGGLPGAGTARYGLASDGFAAVPTALTERQLVVGVGQASSGTGPAGYQAGLDLVEGSVTWAAGIGGGNAGGGPVGEHHVTLSMVNASEDEVVPELVARDLADGDRVWCTRVGDPLPDRFQPVLSTSDTAAGDVLVVRGPVDDAGEENRLVRIRAEDGSVVSDASVGSRMEGVDAFGDLALITDERPNATATIDEILMSDVNGGNTEDRALHALAEDGSEAWNFALDRPGMITTERVAAVDEGAGIVVVLSFGVTEDEVDKDPADRKFTRVYTALDRNGQQVWQQELEPGSKLGHVVDHGLLDGDFYYRSDWEERHLLDVASGEQVLDFRLDDRIRLDEADVVDGHAYAFWNAEVHSVDLATGATDRFTLPARANGTGLRATDTHLVLEWEGGLIVAERG